MKLGDEKWKMGSSLPGAINYASAVSSKYSEYVVEIMYCFSLFICYEEGNEVFPTTLVGGGVNQSCLSYWAGLNPGLCGVLNIKTVS